MIQPGKYLKERDIIIEFYENDSDYKPLNLVGSSPAAKLFLKDLKVSEFLNGCDIHLHVYFVPLQISFEETSTTGPVTLVEGDFKVQHEHLVLGYLSRKFGPASVSPEAAALSDTLIYEASQPVCLPHVH